MFFKIVKNRLYLENYQNVLNVVLTLQFIMVIIESKNKFAREKKRILIDEYIQHERPCCIKYTNTSRKRVVVYLIQHGRECCI